MDGSLPPLIAPRYLIASLVAHGVIAATPLARPPASPPAEGLPPLVVTMRQAIVAVPPSATPEPRPPVRSARLPAGDRRLAIRPIEAPPTPAPVPVAAPTVVPDPVAVDPPPSVDHDRGPLPPLARLTPESERPSLRSGPSDTHLLSLYTQELVARVNRERMYPKLARIRGWQGTTVIDVRIGADGEVLSLDVASSSGHDLLDEQALRMIRDAAPLPTPSAADPAPLLVQVPITFSLR